MKPVLRRIALHGGLTALLLGVIGLMFAELASIWLAASPGTRATTGDPIAAPDSDGAMSAALRSRVPLLMAVWGFVFVAVGELALYYWRGEKQPKPAVVTQPDETEKLLAELLLQAEAMGRERAEDSRQRTEIGETGHTPAQN